MKYLFHLNVQDIFPSQILYNSSNFQTPLLNRGKTLLSFLEQQTVCFPSHSNFIPRQIFNSIFSPLTLFSSRFCCSASLNFYFFTYPYYTIFLWIVPHLPQFCFILHSVSLPSFQMLLIFYLLS